MAPLRPPRLVDADDYRLPYVPKGAWLEERDVRCGRRCRCRDDKPHGSYWRLCWREGGRRLQRYVAGRHAASYREAVRRCRNWRVERKASLEATAAAVNHARQLLRSVR